MKNAFLFFISFAFCTAGLFSGCAKEISSEPRDAAKERANTVRIAKDAYVYGFPLVLAEISKRQMTNPLAGTDNVPVNQLRHNRLFADDKLKHFVKPSADVLYSLAWLDLAKEPMLLEIPDTGERYAFFTAVNSWGNIFASDGKRTAGTQRQKIAFTGPGWAGSLPDDFDERRSATNMVWLVGRVQVNGKQDAETAVRKIQDEIKLYPLSAYGKKYNAPKGRADETITVKPHLEQVITMNINDFFNIMNQLMINNPPYHADADIMDKMLDMGVAPGMRFDITTFDFDTQEAFKEIPKWFNGYMESLKNDGIDNGWVRQSGLGNYKTDYLARAKAAYFGTSANLGYDVIYMSSHIDSDGKKYDGSKKYILHFDKDNIPAVNAFWSVSVYDVSGFFVKNTLNRFSLGSRDKLKFNKDDSLDIYIQKDNPGKDRQSNWLASPDGGFYIILSSYWPKEIMLEGKWKTPNGKAEDREQRIDNR
ncbi:MAG: DUF1254 domain-containing protein [Endomicrobia bacterium]|nr:DUF1254 domain-containing protein [Endomicrobiia bacterium]